MTACKWRALASSSSSIMAEALSLLLRCGRDSKLGLVYAVMKAEEVDSLVKRALQLDSDSKGDPPCDCPMEELPR